MANPSYMGLAGSLARARKPPAQNDVYMQQPRGTGRPPQQFGGSPTPYGNQLQQLASKPGLGGPYGSATQQGFTPSAGFGGGIAGINATGGFQNPVSMSPPMGGGRGIGMMPPQGGGFMGGMGGLMEQAAGTIGGMGAGLPSGGAPGRGQGQGFFGGHDTSGGFFGGNPGTQYMGGMGGLFGGSGPSMHPGFGGGPQTPPMGGGSAGGLTDYIGALGGGPAFGGGPTMGGNTDPNATRLTRPNVPGFGGGPVMLGPPKPMQVPGFGGGPVQTPLEDYQRRAPGRRFP